MEDQTALVMDKWVTKLSEVFAQHSPEIQETVLMTVKISAVYNLLGTLLFLSLGICGFIWSHRYFKRFQEKYNDPDVSIHYYNEGAVYFGVRCGSGLSILVGLLMFELYALIGLWRPEVFLTAKLLGWTH